MTTTTNRYFRTNSTKSSDTKKVRRFFSPDPREHQKLRFQRFRRRWASRLCFLKPESEPDLHLSDSLPSSPSTHVPSSPERKNAEKLPRRPALRRPTTGLRPSGIDLNGSLESSGIKYLFCFGARASDVRLRATNPDPQSSSAPSSVELSGTIPLPQYGHAVATGPLAPVPRRAGSSRKGKSAIPRSRLPVDMHRTVSGPAASGDPFHREPDSKNHSSMLTLLMGTVPGQANHEESRAVTLPDETASVSNQSPGLQTISGEKHLKSRSSTNRSDLDGIYAPSNSPESSAQSDQSLTLPIRSLDRQEAGSALASGSSRHRKRHQRNQVQAKKVVASEGEASETEDTTLGRFVIYTRPNAQAPTIIPGSNGVFIHTGYPMDITDVQICSGSANFRVDAPVNADDAGGIRPSLSSLALLTTTTTSPREHSETPSRDETRRLPRDGEPSSSSQRVISSAAKGPRQRALLEETAKAARSRRSHPRTPGHNQSDGVHEAESHGPDATDTIENDNDNGYGRYERIRLWD